MVLVRQLTTAGFRPISKYESIVPGSQSFKIVHGELTNHKPTTPHQAPDSLKPLTNSPPECNVPCTGTGPT